MNEKITLLGSCPVLKSALLLQDIVKIE